MFPKKFGPQQPKGKTRREVDGIETSIDDQRSHLSMERWSWQECPYRLPDDFEGKIGVECLAVLHPACQNDDFVRIPARNEREHVVLDPSKRWWEVVGDDQKPHYEQILPAFAPTSMLVFVRSGWFTSMRGKR